MSIIEALNKIRSEPRWYYQMRDGELIPETTLIVTAQRIENGRCKPDTIKRFFETFGYKVEINERVIKNMSKTNSTNTNNTNDYYGCPSITAQNHPHYNNDNGSLYKIASDLNLNAYEFDILKRIARCRKKGQFEQDLQKIKDTVDLYLKEHKQ